MLYFGRKQNNTKSYDENNKTIVWNVLFGRLAGFGVSLNCLGACVSACACALCTCICNVYTYTSFHKLQSFKSISFPYTLSLSHMYVQRTYDLLFVDSNYKFENVDAVGCFG